VRLCYQPSGIECTVIRGGDGSQVAQGRVARLCGAQGPAEGDCHAVRDRDQEDLEQRGVQGVHEQARLRHDLSGFGWLRGVHEGGQGGQRQGAEVARAGEVRE